MGNLFAKVMEKFVSHKDVRVLMLGLDAAGKTTILYKIKLNETVNTIPTIGFNVEQLVYKNLTFNCWDIGGQTKLRGLWQHYYDNTQGLMFVVDSNDPGRLEEARESLHSVLSQEEMNGVPVMIYANKQDLPQAVSISTITEKLGLTTLRNTEWFIQSACATNGSGLYEGLDWLAKTIK